MNDIFLQYWGPFKVMFKRLGKLVHHYCRIRLRQEGNIITLHGHDETLSYANALGRTFDADVIARLVVCS
ncbi:hypothetical protein [Noviherbaspirillum malthae]|uniref:hypothetical protein n=1 Tax=Noviherbaspirillum malthae TaxID=1260987 RepID=UPI001890A19C|nr:hypothetical protein [Noviherbaspirillum malthae]